MTGHFTYTSENLIYCMSCRKCPTAVYIGETGCTSACRFREHRLNVLSNRRDLPEAQHFNRRKSLPRGHASGRDENRSTSERSPTARKNALYLQLWHTCSSRNQPWVCFAIKLIVPRTWARIWARWAVLFAVEMLKCTWECYEVSKRPIELSPSTRPWKGNYRVIQSGGIAINELNCASFLNTLNKAVMPKRRCHYLTINSAYTQFLNIFGTK